MNNNYQKKAFLKFKTRSGNLYIYDASTNMIFPDIDGFSEIVENYYSSRKEEIITKLRIKYGAENISNNIDYIEKIINLFNAFYFRNNNFSGNQTIDSEDFFYKKIANINQIVLELTQTCNLRCSYCIYSGKYDDYRTHSHIEMSEEIALKSIDKYLELIISQERTRKYGRTFINFYGGEPLLNFEMIKKVVDHIKKLINKGLEIQDKLYFTITTNGLLLKENVLDFLVENDFLLAISLDGPKYENDKNRILKSKKGSFSLVWKNINDMINRYRYYFDSHVVFLSTISSNHDLLEIDNFFETLCKDRYNRVKVSIQKDADFKKQKNFFERLNNKYFSNESYKKIDHFSPFISGFSGPVYKTFFDRIFEGRTDQYTSACTPDGFRFFVSSIGEFHICERINTNFSIGNYRTGIEYEKVDEILRKYNRELIKNRCDQCVAKNFCFICFANSAAGNNFVIDKEKCNEQIKITEASLSELVSLLEIDYDKTLSFLFPVYKEGEGDILMKAFY